MLWSLVKIIVFVALVAAATLGASYLLDMQGGVLIAMGGIEINLTPIKAVIAAVLLVLAVWLFLKLFGLLIALLRFINGDETALSRYFDRNRERKGYEALSDGLMALASGEGRRAMSKASRAERFLDRPDLTTLLTAQAAEMVGDKDKAEAAYKKLLSDDRTRFVGVRGIMKQKLAAGDTDTALALAEKAFAIKPGHEEVQDTLLRLQAQRSDWKGARATLKAKLRHGNLPRDVHRRRDAVLALSEAKGVFSEDGTIESREAAIEANKLSPDLIPAAVMAARSYIDQGQKRYAARVLKKAWEAAPHPDLAAAFAEIEPDETPQERLKRFQQLVKSAPNHRESRLLMAELNIAAEDFPEARRALGDLASENPDARTLTIMAAIERGEGAPDAIVKGWLARAVSAPRGPQWTCENCHHIHAHWQPICDNCGAFDTLAWKTPPMGEAQAPVGTAMLPLIVGQIEDWGADAPDRPDREDEDMPSSEPEDAEILPSDPPSQEPEKPKE
ncbi:HemY domain protein [Pseudooceanicola batsensis HTCC2597]|uniref:HemY domain protein n=1 Tax=Pseudooceanicola batsensis (strain ATCC BAA-863 / DSM 15984 / KCTC 12145 / HTCC2597) TaxID=252305 RepID=A3TXX7_PSEBH|nr:heme biosynthesis HemY N-terminal domain-containing protein [Pseudooceanicola batsensis]EAQ03011.1 HemY domain protein [Pseudooceanicola batsensis HTCC2597]